MKTLRVALCATLVSGAASAQAWDQLIPLTLPTNNPYLHAMTHHTGTGLSYLYGGIAGPVSSNQTWEWNGCRWRQLNPATSPSARMGMAGTYDSARRRSMIFSGLVQGLGPTNEVWEFDGTNWALQATPGPVLPAVRVFSRWAFDPTAGVVVMFGGRGGTTLGDTWIYDPNAATPAARWSTVPSGPALPRESHAMAYHPQTGGVVMFGGFDTSGAGNVWRNDLNVFDPTTGTWTTLVPAGGGPVPPARSGAALAFDPTRGVLVLTKGSNGTTAFRDVWEWDGSNWTDVTPPNLPNVQQGSSPASSSHTLVYDSTRNELIEYARSDMWTRPGIFPNPNPAPVAVNRQFGPTFANVPTIKSDACPKVNTMLPITYTGLVGSGTIIGMISLTATPGLPTGGPHIGTGPLTPLIVYNANQATQSFAVPNAPGATVYFQAVVQQFGQVATFTNAIEIRIGL